jgi:prepilin-type N-terminal cleavage/methylation domain-containing protein
MRAAFTMIELTITLCIMSILSAIAVPGAGRLLDSIHVNGAVVEITSLFGAARHLAIARARQVSVEVDTANRIIRLVSDGQSIREREIGRVHDVSLSATRVRMTYSATGMGYGAANLSVVVRRNGSVDTVFVSRLGRVRH